MSRGLNIVLIIIGAIAVILLILMLSLANFDSQSKVENRNDVATSPPPTQSLLVEITGNGFSPSTLTISQGGTVTFQNIHPQESWPASAAHPTHNVYPEGGGCIGSAFDACGGINPDYGTYSFTFNEKGTWNYHDHLNPSTTGTIIVN